MCTANKFYEDALVSGIIGSLIAGFLTIGILELYKYYKLEIQHRKFKKIFGIYDKDKLHLVLPKIEVRKDIIDYLRNTNFVNCEFPLSKSGGINIKSSKLLPYSDTISLKYLIDIIASRLGSKSLITVDEDLSKHLDLSFISFGGTSFYCSLVLQEPENKYYYFDNTDIVSKKDNSTRFKMTNEFDYGFIIKYKPVDFPGRIWIVIAGLGESGTSGAGWYLSRHWEELSNLFQNKAFGIVVKVKHGIDESAIKVDQIL